VVADELLEHPEWVKSLNLPPLEEKMEILLLSLVGFVRMPLPNVCFTLFCHFSCFDNFIKFSAHLLTYCEPLLSSTYLPRVTPFSPALSGRPVSRSPPPAAGRCSLRVAPRPSPRGSLVPEAAAREIFENAS